MRYEKLIILLAVVISLVFLTSCSAIDDFFKINKPKVTQSKVGLTGFEAQAEQKICAQKQCVTAVYKASNDNILELVILGNENIENFLRENGISTGGFVETVNFLEVLRNSEGDIKHLRFLIPKNETNSDDKVETGLCKNIRVDCSVDIIVPTENSDISNWIDAGCLFFYTVVAVPDYFDAACVIYALS